MVASWWPCCCEQTVSCGECEGGIGPAQLSWEVTGFANGFGYDCTSCASLDGTYILDFVDDDGTFCTWSGEFSTDCGTMTIDVQVNELGITVIMDIGGQSVTFSLTFTSAWDCLGLKEGFNPSIGGFVCETGGTVGKLRGV